MCIQNTSNVTKTIGVTLKLNSVMEKITNHMNEKTRLTSDQTTVDILNDVGKAMKEIREQSAKMIEARSKVII